MDKSKTIFDYIAEAFMIFGFTVVVFLLFSVCFGNIANEVSSLFALGAAGLSLASLAQLFFLSVMIVLLRFVFLTDSIIHNKSIVFRTVALASCILLLIILFVIIFDWFPADMPIAWLSFGISFAVCFVLSFLLSSYKEKLENKKMAEALEAIKKGD